MWNECRDNNNEISVANDAFWIQYQKYYVYLVTRPECSSKLFIELEDIDAGYPDKEGIDSGIILLISILAILI
jgi:hypothetical protein